MSMSERELQHIAIRVANLQHENSTYGQVHDLRKEIDTVCLDSQRLLSEVRRSHTEAAELRERVAALENALREARQPLQDIVDECGAEGSWPEVEAIEKIDAALSPASV